MSAEQETVVQPNTPPANPAAADPPVGADQGAAPENQETRERDDKGRFRNPLQPRIDELTRDKHAARREADYWKQRAEALEKPPEPAKTKPTPDQFDDYGAYVEALADWKADEKVNTRLAERDKTSAQTKQAETRQSNWEKSAAEARKAHADYDSVMAASEVPVAQHVTDILLDSENGARLAYHLDRNPEIADRLNKMTPTQAARELGRIEAKFEPVSADPGAGEGQDPPEVKDPTPPPAAKKTTNAPPPVKPTGSSKSTTVPLEKMSMDEYVKTRKSQGARWAR